MADAKFRIGNLERLLTLPVPSESVKAAPVRAGAVLTALNGRRTVQTFGYNRSWEFKFDAVTLEEAAEFESLYLGNIQSPYYMFDPARKNLLPLGISAPNTDEPGIGFTPSNWASIAALRVEHTSPATSPVPSATTSMFVQADGETWIRRSDENHRGEPLIPGQQYTFSGHVNTTAGSLWTYATYRDAAGTDLVNVYGNQVTTTGWTRHAFVTTPPAGAVYGEFGFYTDLAGFTGNIGPCQLELGGQATTWVPGYGTPAVSVETIDIEYPRFGIANVTATILEL